jgi:hypothetical protein
MKKVATNSGLGHRFPLKQKGDDHENIAMARAGKSKSGRDQDRVKAMPSEPETLHYPGFENIARKIDYIFRKLLGYSVSKP